MNCTALNCTAMNCTALQGSDKIKNDLSPRAFAQIFFELKPRFLFLHFSCPALKGGARKKCSTLNLFNFLNF